MKMKLHDKIRRYRKQAKLTQAEAAAIVNVSLRTWQRWESGDTKNISNQLEIFLAKSGLGPPITPASE